MVEDAYTKLQPRRFNWNVSHVESISRVWLSFDTRHLIIRVHLTVDFPCIIVGLSPYNTRRL